MKTPQAVISEAQGLIDQYGCHLEFIGKFENRDAYLFVFPDGEEIGFPFIYLYDSQIDIATEITGFEALDLLDRL